MHENKSYRPWYIARGLEFCYGLIAVGAVTVGISWSPSYIASGAALIFVGLIALAALSVYVSKCEQAEIQRQHRNDS